MSIKTEINKQIAKVILARPDLHNAFNEEMVRDLEKSFSELEKNPQVRVIVLAAEGKSFCAGADLNWMKSMLKYSFDENVNDALRLGRMLRKILECKKPVIGRVHGPVFGGGVGLVSVCDISVAVEYATFSLSEVKLGLIPAVISPFVLRKMPVSFAHRYFLTAERFTAHEALKMGLVSEVVADQESLDRKINELIDNICKNGPEAIAICKEQIGEIAGLKLDDALNISAKKIAERRVSKEGQEGMQAFLEKRSPYWVK